jgi:AraC-like DNA-binding protein
MSVLSRSVRHPALVGVVDRVWVAAPGPVSEQRLEWILPTGKAQLILSPESSLFVGPKVLADKIARRTGAPMAGVSLLAGAASSLHGADAEELCGATVGLDAVMRLGSLPEQLADCAPGEALDLLEFELVRRLSTTHIDHQVLAVADAIRRGAAAATVIELRVGDRRSFVPKFRGTVGFGPKHYERICRFNRAVEAIRRPDASPLASIAADSGYADQAHLTREVRHFAQLAPSCLHRDGAEMVNHIDSDKIFKT